MTEENKQVVEEEIEATEQDTKPAEETVNEEVNEDVLEEVTAEQQKMIELEEQVKDLNNRLLRVHADYDNFRRRTKEEKEAAAKYRSQSLVEELLPVLDNFERALNVETENDEAKSLLQGMEMVYRQLQDAFNKEGVEAIDPVGQTFDPHLHQAVMQVQDDNFESNQVVEAFQKGYKLKDRVIRPAMVKVNS